MLDRGFGSDNHAPVHPDILASLLSANTGHMPSYGTDPMTCELNSKLEEIFGHDTESFPVFNGTGANILALRHLCQDSEAVLCSSISHINVDECGAPERIAGVKLIALPHKNGKLELSSLKEAVIRRGDQHFAQVKAISLTQPTEYGTCYSIQELEQICLWAKSEGLKIHLDGARLANAAHFLGVDLKQISFDLGVDALSFGGTKNGLMMGELVIIRRNKQVPHRLKYLRKQSLQLPSKTRFISAQFLTYFKNNLWKQIASFSCYSAQKLGREIHSLNLPEVKISQPIESNAVFVKIPQPWIKPLRESVFFYVWDEHNFECRLMTSWDTTQEEITTFISQLKNLAK